MAFDIGIFENGKYVEGNTKREAQLYEEVRALGKGLGLAWGGDNSGFRDVTHFETKKRSVADASSSGLIKIRRSAKRSNMRNRVPCIVSAMIMPFSRTGAERVGM